MYLLFAFAASATVTPCMVSASIPASNGVLIAKMASTPSTARSTDARSLRSPVTILAPSLASSRAAGESALRVKAWTLWPLFSRSRATWPPCLPVAPVASTFMPLRFMTLPPFSETFLFQVVYIEPAVHHAIARHVLLDVVLHVFLQFRGQVTQAQVAFPVVPDDDVGSGTFLGMLADPRDNLVVGRAGGDKQPERIVVNLSELQPPLIERAVGVVFALPADEDGAALVHCASGQHIAAQRFARAARELFAVPQIAGQQFDFFEVFFHGSLLLAVPRSSVRFPESLAEVNPPAFRKCGQIACAAQEVLVRRICHEQVGDIRHRDPVRVPSDELKRVTGGDVSVLKDRKIEAGPTTALEALDHIRSAKANAELKARHSRLRDDEFGRTRAEAITNVYVAFQQAFGGEVLAEHAPREFCARQLFPPKRVVLRRVGIHRLVTPAVDGKVGLPIAFHVQPRHVNPSS